MPKEPMPAVNEVAVEAAPTPASALSLEEFCARLSINDKRVEMIGGFAYTEKVAGRTKDYEDGYRQRYAAFINQPA